MISAKDIIDNLQLIPHPEGGYYRETYRSSETTINSSGASRNVCTSIYYMLENNDKSHFHRIRSDELCFFHLGDPVELLYIVNGKIHSAVLGKHIQAGELLFFRIPANIWFAAHIKGEKGFSLLSCTVAPGFDFADFELAERDSLIMEYPLLKELIYKFTRK